MCGIVGYIGEKKAAPILLSGLKKLEYRGYDSAGIAIQEKEAVKIIKKEGKLDKLKASAESEVFYGGTGIGHTRWATHGRPSDINSHPHTDSFSEIVIVHNGIIENFRELKEELIEQGHRFKSETDTEVVAHLISTYYDDDLKTAVSKAVKSLEGSFALAVMSHNEKDRIIAVRKDSPLIIGLGENENFLASDIPAYLEHTDNFYILEDGEIADIRKNEVDIYKFNGDLIANKTKTKINWDAEMAEKQGYDHFMLKEIHEQPESLKRLLEDNLKDGKIDLTASGLAENWLDNYDKIHIVACGTAYHSGALAKYLLEDKLRIPVEVEVASEYRYRNPIVNDRTLMIVVSQSGETADTLAALRLARSKGASVLALTNSRDSSIARESDMLIYLKAGPEIAVASTKAYTNMVAAFYILLIDGMRQRDDISEELVVNYTSDLIKLPEMIRKLSQQSKEQIEIIANKYAQKENIFFIGRNTDYTLALEGALKLKEISYIHAEAYPAGELKHGTLALVEENVPVVALGSRADIFAKLFSNLKEVKARGAETLLITEENQKFEADSVDYLIELPVLNKDFAGLLAIIPLQLLAYYTALNCGEDIDQPRNLAKSVTVE
ncbi:Glucosamine--fructose-6-phosphate aminotransferase [isomerizing] [Halanaerobium saccharolyticum subsp. saccharolyticum DSM 6643]|uniref:Glutamine--fructose-6-phosphate aminotransferase [isomerizing] n=1 Tax=Halanaerobium saccharolyticum subsp. saccharolyticum DSM 6643 TaxID=1293054 RepID=M5DX96_9FIRM|nr:glutamine--fructose-6-phosphate transaminase (isomerizing) [Halanaerobium saccharolyticum]CCU77713.1 Glucosamine--fructose-6-phosphate aminotransferase [isomerizing] [Halanaerobium saccharolyticum subsp. saccharolyticum DSM 6643]